MEFNYPLTPTTAIGHSNHVGAAGGSNAGYTWITSPGYQYIGYNTSEPIYDVKIRKVANGLVAIKGGMEYVFSNPEALARWLIKQLEGK